MLLALSFFSLVDSVSDVEFSDTSEHVISVYITVIDDSVAWPLYQYTALFCKA